jgi:hypothetical protein
MIGIELLDWNFVVVLIVIQHCDSVVGNPFVDDWAQDSVYM